MFYNPAAKRVREKSLYLQLPLYYNSGDNGDEDPPVPIPREQSAALPKVFRLRKAAEHRS